MATGIFEKLKEDKKKLLIVLGFVAAILLTVLLSVLKACNNEEGLAENVSDPKGSDVVIPVDSMKIGRGEYGGAKGSSADDFFDVDHSGPDSSVIDDDGERRKQAQEKPVYISSSRYTHREEYRPKVATIPNQQERHSVTDQSVANSEKKRRRAPSDDYSSMGTSGVSMIRGVVANENKAVKNGSYVKIRIAEDVQVGSVLLPRNSVVTGIAKHNGERTDIEIKSVRIGNETKSVSWVVYDEDGNLGLPIPASVLNDIAKDGTSEVIEEGGSKVEATIPVIGNVKVNLKKKNEQMEYVIPNGHRLYIKEKK